MSSVLLQILLFAPLLGFLVNGLRFRSKNHVLAGMVATAAVAASFVAAILLFLELLSLPADSRSLRVEFFQWLNVGGLSIPFSFVIDQLSGLMILIITGVGTLIHLFSIGYMAEDDRPSKYFAYLNLFVFNMLLLVTGDNLILMFFGWEGVGLCSYLLIGFWFTDSAKAAAGMKAFVTNRVGDAGFLLGIFLLFVTFGTLQFSGINGQAAGLTASGWLDPITLAALFLFVGATGKSAQIPLYVWLPDAMAGPTPVSALIHAATMVTAGVYMICRLSFLYIASPQAMLVIAVIGAATLLLAATMAVLQWDIKKVLAYSTVSQLGYMILACGVGAFGAAMFHLMTHAFFKALMFLGSGSVIHGMHHEQDIRKMGGLRKFMPITHLTFAIGWLAIIGAPLFSGFFSKDEILWMTWHSPRGSGLLWGIGILGAATTAFYMTRLMALTFWGKFRGDAQHPPHESPWTMTVPLVLLAVLSAFAGWLGIPHALGAVLPGHPPHLLEQWFAPVLSPIPGIGEPSILLEWVFIAISVTLVTLAVLLALRFYLVRPEIPQRLQQRFPRLYNLVANKYFVDEIYQNKIIEPTVSISRNLWAYVDAGFIDKMTYWVGDFIRRANDGVRSLQNGNIQQYAMYILVGIVGGLLVVLMGS